MVKHVVLFKLKDNSPKNCEKVKEILLTMKNNVPMIQNIEVGVDFLHSDRSYDICLQVEVADKLQLKAYDNDAYHCDVVKKYMSANIISSAVVDYEF